ncbi:MbtH family protein [Streptosporangium sp. 'caverna']|uniref:MbtH family protein n=1 Tax=Streptosporangium sp. 'caverna' TaxID=2202249 RepID=UPI000D7E1680|nr:MbtH family protein [Streptosporangium sp. 'caverna']AWS45506.1 antibiotic synthesis protein MbtH [Streptosporangium sp. 'caverna']
MGFPVVLTNEERYSLRLAGGESPAGRRSARFEGSKEDRLAHIDRVRTDLRPLGVRQAPA